MWYFCWVIVVSSCLPDPRILLSDGHILLSEKSTGGGSRFCSHGKLWLYMTQPWVIGSWLLIATKSIQWFSSIINWGSGLNWLGALVRTDTWHQTLRCAIILSFGRADLSIYREECSIFDIGIQCILHGAAQQARAGPSVRTEWSRYTWLAGWAGCALITHNTMSCWCKSVSFQPGLRASKSARMPVQKH